MTQPHQLRPLADRTPRNPAGNGLYNPEDDRDSCGVGFIVNLDNQKSHQIVEDGLTLVRNLTHRGAAHIFTPQDARTRKTMEGIVADVIRDEGQELLGWRDVPVDNSSLSQDPDIRRKEPVHRQVFIGRSADIADEEAFERKLYIVRKVISARIYAQYGGLKTRFYVVSISGRTIVYKGMFLAHQLSAYYLDLHDERFQSGLAMVHQRFSTNTFP